MPKSPEKKVLPYLHLWVLLAIRASSPDSPTELLSFLEMDGIKKSLEHICCTIKRLRSSGLVHADQLKLNKKGEEAIKSSINQYRKAVQKYDG